MGRGQELLTGASVRKLMPKFRLVQHFLQNQSKYLFSV
jgi:hypothetical protein